MQVQIRDENLVASDHVESLSLFQKVTRGLLVEIPLIVITEGQGRQRIGAVECAQLEIYIGNDHMRSLRPDDVLGVKRNAQVDALQRPDHEARSDTALIIKPKIGGI